LHSFETNILKGPTVFF